MRSSHRSFEIFLRPCLAASLLTGSLLLGGCASDGSAHRVETATPQTAEPSVRKATLLFTFAKGIDIPTARRFLKEHGALSVTIYETLSKTRGQVMGSAVFPDSPSLLKVLHSSPEIQSVSKEHVVKPL
jgi:hypothetical protein